MIVGVATILVFNHSASIRQVPRECFILALFLIWSLAGGFFVVDTYMFMHYIKLLLELVVLTFFISIIIKNSGDAKWFYFAFFLIAIWWVLIGATTSNGGTIALGNIVGQDDIVKQRYDKANGVGFYSCIGILGMLALLWEVRRWWMRTALIAGGILALCCLVLSASRGAFVALMAIAILWPTMCLSGTSRSKIRSFVMFFFIIIISYFMFEFIVKETYLGTRFTSGTQMKDTSMTTRLDFILIGIRMFSENPVMGCGLGQFGIASGTGAAYAHNEFAEVISSTGIIGIILYYSVYVMAWRRLTQSLRYLRLPLFRYRINIARVLLLVLLLSGFLFRINFIQQDSMFLIAIVIGMAYWGEQQARLAYESERENYFQESPKLDRPGTDNSSMRLGWIGDNSPRDKCNSLCLQIEDSVERRRQ